MNVIIVLPVYNEEKSLSPLLTRIGESMRRAGLSCSVLMIDDGSTDGSLAAARSFDRRLAVRILRHATNQGLGSAIRDGLLAAIRGGSTNDVVVTMDADNSQPPELVPQMVKGIAAGSDCVIASRYAPGSRALHVPLYRRLISWVGNRAYRLRVRAPGVKDYTCGLRAYRASILRRGFRLHGERFVCSPGFECMGEILIKLRRLGARFTEIPFTLDYGARPGLSKMRLTRTVRGNLRVLSTRAHNHLS